MPYRFLLAILCLCSLKAACADTYTYTFTFNFDVPPPDQQYSINGYFTYTSPVLIVSDTTFVPDMCIVNNASCNNVRIDPPGGLLTVNIDSSFTNINLQQLPASTFAPGDNLIAHGSLDIQDNVGSSPVPEPSSLALLGSGLIGCGRVISRRVSFRGNGDRSHLQA